MREPRGGGGAGAAGGARRAAADVDGALRLPRGG